MGVPDTGIAGVSHEVETLTHFPFRKTESTGLPDLLPLMQTTISPSDGQTIALRCSKVIRGANIPFVEDFTSSMAETSGNEPSVLMATCENNKQLLSNSIPKRKCNLFMANNFLR